MPWPLPHQFFFDQLLLLLFFTILLWCSSFCGRSNVITLVALLCDCDGLIGVDLFLVNYTLTNCLHVHFQTVCFLNKQNDTVYIVIHMELWVGMPNQKILDWSVSVLSIVCNSWAIKSDLAEMRLLNPLPADSRLFLCSRWSIVIQASFVRIPLPLLRSQIRFQIRSQMSDTYQISGPISNHIWAQVLSQSYARSI